MYDYALGTRYLRYNGTTRQTRTMSLTYKCFYNVSTMSPPRGAGRILCGRNFTGPALLRTMVATSLGVSQAHASDLTSTANASKLYFYIAENRPRPFKKKDFSSGTAQTQCNEGKCDHPGAIAPARDEYLGSNRFVRNRRTYQQPSLGVALKRGTPALPLHRCTAPVYIYHLGSTFCQGPSDQYLPCFLEVAQGTLGILQV